MQEQDKKKCPKCDENQYMADLNMEILSDFMADVKDIKRTLKVLTKVVGIHAGLQKGIPKSKEDPKLVPLIQIKKEEWDEVNDQIEVEK